MAILESFCRVAFTFRYLSDPPSLPKQRKEGNYVLSLEGRQEPVVQLGTLWQMERVNKARPHFLPRLTGYLKRWRYVGKRTAKNSRAAQAVLVMQESENTGETLDFFTTDVQFPYVNAIHI